VTKAAIRVEKSGSQARIVASPGGRFSTTEEIYFCHVLPGDRLAGRNGFSFDLKRLGESGFSELLSHLEQQGYRVDFDSEANEAAEKIARDRKELARSLRTGGLLKRNPHRRIRIAGLKRPLKPFQVPAVEHMAEVAHAANFSVPGSGKTAIALAAFAKLRASKKVEQLIVVGPRSSFAPWEYEFKACLGKIGPVVRITGSRTERAKAWRNAEKAILVLLNYHVAANDSHKLRDFLARSASMLVLDESHHIKSIVDSKWAVAMRSIAPLAKKRVILSGTPAPNSLMDLWSQFNFLYPAESPLGAREQYIYRIETDGSEALDATRKALWPLFWRIKKRDLLLPRPRVTKISVRMGEVQAAIYHALAFKVLKDFEKAPSEIIKLRQWQRARMVRLLQAASNPTLLAQYSEEFKLPPMAASGMTVGQLIDRYPDYEVPAKISRAVALIKKLVSDERKVVVWTSFVHNIRMLLKLLKNASPLPLYGGIALSDEEDKELNRERIIEKFCNDKASRILIANPAACGESISLHRACQDAIYLDRTFNCAHFMQSKDRIHRIGLAPDAKVNYYLLLGRNTVDEAIDRRLEAKQRRMLALLEVDFTNVSLDSNEDVVSEEGEQAIDFAETLAQIAKSIRHGH